MKSSEGKRVLIVEDEEQIAFLMRDILQARGIVCTIEPNGSHALDLAIEGQPDLILLDIVLQGIDGYSVCRRLKQEPRTQNIPIIFVSGLKSEEDVLEAMSVGGAYYLKKPFNVEFFLTKVKEVMRTHPVDHDPSSRKRRIFYVRRPSTGAEGGGADGNGNALVEDVQVIPVDRPDATVQRAKEEQPDLIVLDLDEDWMGSESIVDALDKDPATHAIPFVTLPSRIEKQGA